MGEALFFQFIFFMLNQVPDNRGKNGKRHGYQLTPEFWIVVSVRCSVEQMIEMMIEYYQEQHKAATKAPIHIQPRHHMRRSF